MEFFILGLLGAFGLLALTDIFDNDAESEETDTQMSDEAGDVGFDLLDQADTGASVVENEDGSLDIALGEDETGSLAALKFEETSAETGVTETYSLGFYLVPEGVDIPIEPAGIAEEYDGPQDLIDDLGLEVIAPLIDLGAWDPFSDDAGDDTRLAPPQVNSDDPIDIIRVRSYIEEGGGAFIRTEPDETLSPFEEAGFYRNGAEAVSTDTDFDGTDGDDTVLAKAAATTVGVTLNGLNGNDFLLTDIAQSRVDGGDDNDTLYALGNQSDVRGGAGDDDIIVGPNGTATGGSGDDTLSSAVDESRVSYNDARFDLTDQPEDLGSTLFGGVGDDVLTANFASITSYGGTGNDQVNVKDGAIGFGDNGDDLITMAAGAIADGGAGDDTFQVDTRFGNAGIATGGAGQDIYQISVPGSPDGGSEQYLEITDFDPDADTLRFIGPSSATSEMRVEEAADGSYTDLVATFTAAEIDGGGSNIAIIRLLGVSGLSADQLVDEFGAG